MVLGFLRELVAARLFGASRELDLFLLCFMPFDVMLPATRDVPVALQGRLASLDAPAANRTLRDTARFVIGGAVALSIIYLAAFAWIVPASFPAGTSQAWILVCLFIALAMPVAATHIPLSALGIHKRGFVMFHGYQQIYLNASIAAFLLLLGSWLGVVSMALGVLLGTVLLMAHEWIRLGSDVREGEPMQPTSGNTRALALMIAFVAAQAIGSKATMLVERTVGLSLHPGAISQLNYALRVWGIPVNLFVIAAIVPFSARFATSLAAEDTAAAYRIFTRLIFGLVLAFMPFMIAMSFFGEELITLLFQSGRFTAADSISVAQLLRTLQFGSFGALASTASVYTLWTFGRSASVTVVTWACVAAYFLVSWSLTRLFGVDGLAVGNSIYYNLQALILLLFVRREFSARTRGGGLTGSPTRERIAH